MKKQYFLGLLLLMMSSCASNKNFFQVYDIQSQDVNQKDGVLVYENSDCQINYNLWSEEGNLSFLVQNKTDKNLYLVMPRSFFILNGVANDYYSESTYSHSVTTSASLSSSSQISVSGFLTNGISWYPTHLSRQVSAAIGSAVTEGVETKEPPFVCIPPYSSKFIRGFNISDHVYKDCDDIKQNYPSQTSNEVRFSRDNTPLSFRNRLAYSFDEQTNNIKYIEHTFWLSSLQNYSQKAAINKQKEEECETKEKKVRKRFTMYAPNKFYNKYVDQYHPNKSKAVDGVY